MIKRESAEKKDGCNSINQPEFQQLHKLKKQTRERTILNYLGKLALNKPVTVKYRNATGDDFLRDMLELRRELHALGTTRCL